MTHRPIAVAIIASPLTCPANSRGAELLMSKAEPAKQQLHATLKGTCILNMHTQSHTLLQQREKRLNTSAAQWISQWISHLENCYFHPKNYDKKKACITIYYSSYLTFLKKIVVEFLFLIENSF